MAGGRRWTVEELAAIRDLPEGGIAALAERLKRSPQAIALQRWKRGFGPRRPRWGANESEALDRMVADGTTARDAARALGRKPRGAYGRRYRERRRGEPVATAISQGRRYAGGDGA